MRLAWTRVALLCATAAMPRVALGQGEADTAAARALFSEGRAMADAGDWVQAADRFRRALALRPTPPIRYNLAVALERQGLLVEASEHLRTVARDESADDRTKTSAQSLLRNVEPRIGRLTVTVDGDASGVEILLDGRPLSAALVGVGAPADPGHHRVVARRGGQESTAEGDLEPGAAAEIHVAAPAGSASIGPLPPPDSGAGPGPETSSPAVGGSIGPTESPGPERGPDWVFVALGGVAVVGGVVLDLVPASASNHEFDALDLAPVVLYAAGAALVAAGIL